VLLSISHQKFLVLLMVNILLLILGCIMDMAPLILICTPILLRRSPDTRAGPGSA